MRRKNSFKQPSPERSRAYVRNCERFAALGLPADADCRLPGIVITGGRYLRVEHHTGLLSVSPDSIRLYSRLGAIRIDGCDMIASEMDEDILFIDGRIRAVTFEQFCQIQGKNE